METPCDYVPGEMVLERIALTMIVVIKVLPGIQLVRAGGAD